MALVKTMPDGAGEDDAGWCWSVKTIPDGDGEDVEDDAASIFTIILCLTTYIDAVPTVDTSASMLLLKKGTWHISEYLYYFNFLIDLHEDGVAKGDYI